LYCKAVLKRCFRWNIKVIESLVSGATKRLQELGVKPQNIVTYNVSGSFELPLTCSR
jgi:6,7-dimethyl-8-ribityllumazine synthase